MAKIPGPEGIQQIGGRPTVGPVLARPEAFGAGGAALQTAGAALGRLGEKFAERMALEADKEQRLIDANAKTTTIYSFDRTIFEAFEDQKDKPDFNPADFDLANTNHIIETMGALEGQGVSDTARAAILHNLTGQAETIYQTALLYKNTQNKEKAADLLDTSQDDLEDRVFRNPALLSSSIAAIREQTNDLKGTYFTAASLEKKAKIYVERLVMAAMSGLIEQDPDTALAILTVEKPSPDSPFGQIPFDRRAALIKRARGRIKDLERQEDAAQTELDVKLRAENALRASDLEIAVSRGEAGLAEVEKAFYDGVITGPKRTQLVKNIDNLAEAQAETAGGLLLVATALGNEDIALDPDNTDHRKSVDNYYQTIISPALVDAQPLEQIQAVINFIDTIGMVPAQVQGQIRGLLASGGTEGMIFAADLLGRIRDTNPAALRDFAKEDIALGLHIQNQVERGIKPEVAVRRAQEAVNLSSDDRQVLGLRERQEKLSEKAVDFLVAQAKSGLFGLLSGEESAKIPVALQAEFNTAASDAFRRTGGDPDAALDVAFVEISRVWAMTDVVGGRRMMKFAPERFGLARFDIKGNSEWMREQLLADIGADSAFDPEQWPLEDRLRLEADGRTAREASSGVPSYLVMLRDANGAFEPLLTVDGTLIRWRPDWATSPAFVRAGEEQAEREREAVEAAERVRERVEDDLPVVVY